ncbi:MAG: hypothetical protein MHM6MM_005950 [Cercozoa sp. M6MM]
MAQPEETSARTEHAPASAVDADAQAAGAPAWTGHSTTKRALFLLGGAVCMQMTLGTIYSFGSETVYITSWLRQYVDATYAQTMFTFGALQMAMSISLCICGAVLDTRQHLTRIVAIVAAASMAICVALTSLSRSVLTMVLVYGVMRGASVGCANMMAVMTGKAWWKHRMGMAQGLIAAAFGLGAFGFNFLFTWLVNPENEVPLVLDPRDDKEYYALDSQVVQRVPQTLRTMALVYACLGVLGACFLAPPPGVTRASSKVTATTTTYLATVKRTVSQKKFWALLALWILSSTPGHIVIGANKVYGGRHIGDDRFLTLVNAVGSLTNGIGRLLAGRLMDKFKIRHLGTVMLILQAIFIGTYASEFVLSSRVLFMVWNIAVYLLYGGMSPTWPLAVVDTFGAKVFGRVYGMVCLAWGIGGVTGDFLFMFVGEGASDAALFAILVVMTLACIPLAWVFNADPKLRAQGGADAEVNRPLLAEADEETGSCCLVVYCILCAV